MVLLASLEQGRLGWNGWLGCSILVLTYLIVMTGRMHRAVTALLAAVLMIATGILSQTQALQGIDFNTIGLLAGMMMIVAIAGNSGIFEFLAIWSAKRVRGSPSGILAVLVVVTALISSMLDNVTTVLLVVPVTLAVCARLEVVPYPFLLSQVLASNIGGTATLIGDPPNILIGTRVGISFNSFVCHLAPVIGVVLLAHAVAMHLVWGRRLRATPEARARIMALDEFKAISDRGLMVKSLVVVTAVLLCFLFSGVIGLESGTIGIAGAALLLLLDNVKRPAKEQNERVARVFNEIDWSTLFFFIGLFVLVKGVEQSGVLAMLGGHLLKATGGDMKSTGVGILWVSAMISAVVDNIPFVATMIPMIQSMAPSFHGPDGLMPLWWALSLGACLGGNGTLIGASANLAVAGIAERNGIPFRFLTFTKHALPMMVFHVGICHVYWVFRYS